MELQRFNPAARLSGPGIFAQLAINKKIQITQETIYARPNAGH
ncbi:hypothetical protein SynMEDNS5_00400 [Synechococcus sp. MEDNS5]|nr:hypothetical protein SynMEDNS5_00400 [Synechococcus sp. MEDNS5]